VLGVVEAVESVELVEPVLLALSEPDAEPEVLPESVELLVLVSVCVCDRDGLVLAALLVEGDVLLVDADGDVLVLP
jgi:hypothetical protein